MKPKRRRSLIKILPREPLTSKARAAIHEYAMLKCRDLPIVHLLEKHILVAERMRRSSLYTYLCEHGYRWKRGYWCAPKATSSKPA